MANDLLKGLYVAVTRPLEQAASLSLAIESHGGQVITFPLIAISALDDYREFDQAITQLENADWAIFISSNAVDNALPRIIRQFGELPKNLKFAAIGPQTAKQLSLYGVAHILTPQTRFDTEALLALPKMHAVAGQTVVIFRGLGGREVLAETLKSRGANIIFAECYRRTNPQQDAQLLSRHWQQHELDAVVVTSSEAMRNLISLASSTDYLQHVTLCVNHARIAEPALQLGLKVLVADAPGDEAMLDCLSQLAKDD